jgi:hypothetical protein
MTETISIFVADDSLAMRQAICALLAAGNLPTTVCGEAADYVTALAMAEQLRPAVVLMDLRMTGVELIDPWSDSSVLDFCLGPTFCFPSSATRLVSWSAAPGRKSESTLKRYFLPLAPISLLNRAWHRGRPTRFP